MLPCPRAILYMQVFWCDIINTFLSPVSITHYFFLQDLCFCQYSSVLLFCLLDRPQVRGVEFLPDTSCHPLGYKLLYTVSPNHDAHRTKSKPSLSSDMLLLIFIFEISPGNVSVVYAVPFKICHWWFPLDLPFMYIDYMVHHLVAWLVSLILVLQTLPGCRRHLLERAARNSYQN